MWWFTKLANRQQWRVRCIAFEKFYARLYTVHGFRRCHFKSSLFPFIHLNIFIASSLTKWLIVIASGGHQTATNFALKHAHFGFNLAIKYPTTVIRYTSTTEKTTRKTKRKASYNKIKAFIASKCGWFLFIIKYTWHTVTQSITLIGPLIIINLQGKFRTFIEQILGQMVYSKWALEIKCPNWKTLQVSS